MHTQNGTMPVFGALVQLVRMPACHAGGHESESRTHRNFKFRLEVFLFIGASASAAHPDISYRHTANPEVPQTV